MGQGENNSTAIPLSRSSYIGLNAVNFFLAELVGVITPFLSAYLKEHGWNYDAIGIVIAIGGAGTLLVQVPAGIIADRIKKYRLLLGSMSLILGTSYALLPFFTGSITLTSLLLFAGGAASAFFVPLLATLALALVGDQKFDHVMGVNQGWNHAGNIAAALMALWVVKTIGIVSVFYVTAIVSVFAAASLLLMRQDELKHAATLPEKDVNTQGIFRQIQYLLRDRSILMLVICVALFHLANAPVMPLVSLYLKHLGGGDEQVAMVVLVAQIVMIPVALLAAAFCTSVGRKPVFAFAFLILTLRIFLYSLTDSPPIILAIQALDGIGAGIYGVVIVLMCNDMTQGKHSFNTLLGIMQTATALGGFIGPLVQGFVTARLGFTATFIGFALIAGLGTVLFLLAVPETRYRKQGIVEQKRTLPDSSGIVK